MLDNQLAEYAYVFLQKKWTFLLLPACRIFHGKTDINQTIDCGLMLYRCDLFNSILFIFIIINCIVSWIQIHLFFCYFFEYVLIFLGDNMDETVKLFEKLSWKFVSLIYPSRRIRLLNSAALCWVVKEENFILASCPKPIIS